MSKSPSATSYLSKFIASAFVCACLTSTASIFPLTSSVQAAPTAATATGAAISTSSAETQKVLENLEKIARDKDQSDQIKNIYDDINAKKRGFIAQVVSVKDKTVKVKTSDEDEQFLTFDKSTALISKGKETTADQVEVSDWVSIDGWLVIIGVEEDDQFLPRRVLISSVNLTPKEKIVQLGNVVSISKAKITYTPKNSEEAREMKIDSKTTTIEDKDGNPLKITDIKADMPVLATGVVSLAGGDPTASTVKILQSFADEEEGADSKDTSKNSNSSNATKKTLN